MNQVQFYGIWYIFSLKCLGTIYRISDLYLKSSLIKFGMMLWELSHLAAMFRMWNRILKALATFV